MKGLKLCHTVIVNPEHILLPLVLFYEWETETGKGFKITWLVNKIGSRLERGHIFKVWCILHLRSLNWNQYQIPAFRGELKIWSSE
jgi:hypothetical protein